MTTDERAATTVRFYEIAVRGDVGPNLAAALEGFRLVATDGGQSLFRGRVPDQTGLQAALETLASLGMELTGLRCLKDDP